MSVRTKLSDDFDAGAVRRLAMASKDAAQTRRLMALTAIYEGGSHKDAARIGGVTPQIVRDWVVRFNARGAEGGACQRLRSAKLNGVAGGGLIVGHAGGSVSKLTKDHRRALAKMIDDGPPPASPASVAGRSLKLAPPDPAVDGEVRWRLKDLAAWLASSMASRSTRPRSAVP